MSRTLTILVAVTLAVTGLATAAPAAAATSVTGTADSFVAPDGADRTLRVAAPGVLGNDTADDGSALTATVASFPSNGGLALAPDGSFSYAPAAGYVGTDTFTYVAAAGDVTSAPVAVTITVPPARPVAVDDAYTTGYDTAITVAADNGLVANDVDGEGSGLSVVDVTSSGVDGTLAVQPDGSFSYTPGPGFTGVTTFGYRLADGGGQFSDPATVRVTVLGADSAPDAFTTVAAGPPLAVAAPGLLGNDVGTGALSAALVARPVHGQLLLAADGSFRYTPKLGYVGTDTFTYTATDDLATSRPETVTLTVDPARADLGITARAARLAAADGSATLTLVVTNRGPSNPAAQVTVTLPGNLTVSAAPGGRVTAGGRSASFGIARQTTAKRTVLTVTVQAAPDVHGSRTIVSTVTGIGADDPATADNSVNTVVRFG